jgi:hypothetical protein
MKDENLKKQGLISRYKITKLDGSDVDPNAHYFVLRLDKNGSDKKHIAACRKAICVYAEEIKDHLPHLAYDLKKLYDIPESIKEDMHYMSRCDSDMGFMGSPRYMECKQRVEDYFATKEQL